MRIIVFEVSVEVPDEESSVGLDNLLESLEEVIAKHNYDLYASQWYDE